MKPNPASGRSLHDHPGGPVRTVVLATFSPGKLDEFRWLAHDLDFRISPLAEVAPDIVLAETGATAQANAEQKARTACRVTGLPTLGDDSALHIDGLAGGPGASVRRWQGQLDDSVSDEDWLAFFVAKVSPLPESGRRSQLETAVALAMPTPDGVRVQTATCTSGFVIQLPPQRPYPKGMPINSVRYIPELGRRYLDLTREEQLAVHRGALRQPLARMLAELPT